MSENRIRQDLTKLYSARSMQVLNLSGNGRDTTFVVHVEHIDSLPKHSGGYLVARPELLVITPEHVKGIVQDARSAIQNVRSAKREAGLSAEAMIDAPEEEIANIRPVLAKREGVLRTVRVLRVYRNKIRTKKF